MAEQRKVTDVVAENAKKSNINPAASISTLNVEGLGVATPFPKGVSAEVLKKYMLKYKETKTTEGLLSEFKQQYVRYVNAVRANDSEEMDEALNKINEIVKRLRKLEETKQRAKAAKTSDAGAIEEQLAAAEIPPELNITLGELIERENQANKDEPVVKEKEELSEEPKSKKNGEKEHDTAEDELKGPIIGE